MVNEQNIKIDIAKDRYAELVNLGSPENDLTWQEAITHAEQNSVNLVVDIRNLALQKLSDEIAKDPAGMGYAGKTDEEVANLVSVPWYEEKTENYTVPLKQAIQEELSEYEITVPYLIKKDGTVICNDQTMKAAIEEAVATAKTKLNRERVSQIEHGPRIAVALSDVPYMANAVTAEDVAATRKI